MKRMLAAALTCAVLAGCATTQAPVKPVKGASVMPLASTKIAVSYQLVDKRIGYSEVLYRVFWLEQRAAAQDFSGIWQADRDLTGYAVERMRQQGFMVDSVYAIADAATVEASKRQTAALAHRSAPAHPKDNPNIQLAPPATWFAEAPHSPAFQRLAEQLRGKGYAYLAEFTGMNLFSSAPGYGLVSITDAPNLRFIDLATGRVIWTCNIGYGQTYQLGGDFRQLEANDLQTLKLGLQAGMAKVDFVGLLGVKPYGSDW